MTITLAAGLNYGIVWPGANVAIGSAVSNLPAFMSAYWWNVETEEYHVYIHGAPDFVNAQTPLSRLRPGYTYVIQVSAASSWVVTVPAAGAGSREAADSAPTGAAPGSTWTATVTCDSGPSPLHFSAATEQGAIKAANWVVCSPGGCAGAGTYTISAPPSP